MRDDQLRPRPAIRGVRHPLAADPAGLIRHAQAAERAGLDLIAIRDHPYQPAFLDTLTLLGPIVARTERIRVTGDVLNLALRPAAVLAKSLATLDIFGGGRVEAGLGAGGFWDAIESYGAPRLTPGQAVDALGEAIRVMRAVWGENGRGPQHVEGRYHRLDGAAPDAVPPHLPQIWVGAYKPRMLAVTGALADGWLPSLHRMTLAEIVDANTRIGGAARGAGRDPISVRRVANLSGRLLPTRQGVLQGPPAQRVEELTALALDYDFSGFIVTGDDAADYRVVGEVIALAVREAVSRERGRRG